jgi:hypothetical protein
MVTWGPKGEGPLDGQLARPAAEKEPLALKLRARTKTDTGRRGEYPKALERTEVKELGKLTP